MPRSGELLRASSLSYYEKIPFEKSFGTIVTERIIDVIILIGLLLCGVMISSKIGIPKLSISNELLLSIIPLITLVSIVFYYVISKTTFKNKFEIFIGGLKKGVLSVSKINNKPLFVFHSLFIWTCYFLMFYVVKFSLPETFDLGFEPLFIAFLAGAMAMALTNGGIGAYPLAIAAVISQYEISYESALALGWIVWTSQTLMIITLWLLIFCFFTYIKQII